MDHIPHDDLVFVGEAARAVVREAKAAWVWIFGGGVPRQAAHRVSTDGTIEMGSLPEEKAVIGGFSIVEVESLTEANRWAAKFAKACQCTQEVREIPFDPES